jgi:hypothetical protein
LDSVYFQTFEDAIASTKEEIDCEKLLPGQFLCNELASIDPATQQPAGAN